MKTYYEKRIAEYTKAAQKLDLMSEQETKSGCGVQSEEYATQARMNREEATKYREALDMLEKVS